MVNNMLRLPKTSMSLFSLPRKYLLMQKQEPSSGIWIPCDVQYHS